MIFLDTNYIVALSLKQHEDYKRANEIWETIGIKKKIISKLIIVEVLNVLNKRLKVNMELTEKVCKFMADELVVINEMNDIGCYTKAMKYMKQYYPERIQFADCVFIAVIEELEIEEIVSFDSHFDLNKNIKRIH